MIEAEEGGMLTTARRVRQARRNAPSRRIIDEAADFVLTTTFDSTTLHLDLQLFHHEHESVSFFQLSLTNDSLTEGMTKVFGSVAALWETSFLKKENYAISGNRLQIECGIQLRSDILRCQFMLQLLPVHKTQIEILSAYCKKIKEENRRMKEQMERMRLTIEEVMTGSHLIPFRSGYSHLLNINGDVVHYKNIDWYRKILCLNAEKFDFSVTTIAKHGYYGVGVIAEEFVHQSQIWQSKCIFFDNFGSLWKDNIEIKDNLFTPPPRLIGTSDSVRVAVDRPNNTISFHIDDGHGQTATETTDLSNFAGCGRLFPFIEFSFYKYALRVIIK